MKYHSPHLTPSCLIKNEVSTVYWIYRRRVWAKPSALKTADINDAISSLCVQSIHASTWLLPIVSALLIFVQPTIATACNGRIRKLFLQHPQEQRNPHSYIVRKKSAPKFPYCLAYTFPPGVVYLIVTSAHQQSLNKHCRR